MDIWLFATDWPYGDTAWPGSVQQIAERPGLTAPREAQLFGAVRSARRRGFRSAVAGQLR